MAYRIQSSFSAGELDPALHERTTFDKFKTGLATLRNAFIGKTGRAISRGGQLHDIATKISNRKCVLFSPPYTQYVIEWGHLYVRIHNTVAGTYTEDAHDFVEDDLDYLQFVPSGSFLYIFRFGKKMKKMVIGALSGTGELQNRFVIDSWIFRQSPVLTTPALVSSIASGNGYLVEYLATFVYRGEESSTGIALSGGTIKLPIAAAEQNLMTALAYTNTTPTADIPTEMKVYRRPAGGGAFGYIGSTNLFTSSGANYLAVYTDIGADADYTHIPPANIALISDPLGSLNQGPIYAYGRAGAVYQQRLLITEQTNEEAIYTSRTSYHRNLTRDYPYSSDSALAFKAGTSGNAKVLRVLDNDGLVVFTTVGIFANTGALSPDNSFLDKKGNWVIEETVPPLEVPGGVLFVDKTTNTIRSLIFSNEAGGYPGEEMSIFSNHLFMNKKVKSWAFQDGDTPLIWVILDDGSLVALTYQREHEMRAWSRHDTDGLYESVTVLKDLQNKSVVYFGVKRGERRFIEKSSPRFVADIKEFVGMDCATTFNTPLDEDAEITVTAADPEDWEGALTIASNTAIFTNTAGNGAEGTIFRFFDSQGSAVDLEVTAFVDTKHVTVEPSAEFPSDQTSDITLYKTFTTLTGLDHLNGKSVSVMVDGYVIASPNNDVDDYAPMIVTSGTLTLPNPGAFVHVGLPFTSDVETLDIDTVEQKPTLLESMIIHKVYLKIYNTRGLYIGSAFPANDSVVGMEDLDERSEDIDLGNIGNAAQVPQTKRLEPVIPNDWKSRGHICLRQVDPLPFEILSIIPDLSVLL